MNVPTFEAVDSGGNCELWKQVQVGLSSDQGLSWPDSAHSRSRNSLRYIGGLPKQANWQDLTVRTRIQKAEPQKKCSYYFSLCIILFSSLFCFIVLKMIPLIFIYFFFLCFYFQINLFFLFLHYYTFSLNCIFHVLLCFFILF